MVLAASCLTDTAVISLVVLLNTAIGVTQETRADRAIKALGRLQVAGVVVPPLRTLLGTAPLTAAELAGCAAAATVPALGLLLLNRLTSAARP